jgi:hypothetical protein
MLAFAKAKVFALNMTGKKTRTFTSAFDTYTVVQQIGCGGTGTVFEVNDSEGQRLALKTVDATKTPRGEPRHIASALLVG